MKIKLIAADLDGTTLRTDKTVSRRTVSAIRAARDRGCLFVPATGRIAKMMPKQLLAIPGIRYAVTSNGAAVRDFETGSVLFANLMSMESSNKIVRLISETGLLAEAYCEGLSYADRDALGRLRKLNPPEEVLRYVLESQSFVDDLPGFIAARNVPLEKINVPYVPDEMRGGLYRKLGAMKEYCVYSSSFVNLEVNAAGCSKGNALRRLCALWNIDPSQVMAVGDSDNDASMLRLAGLSVAMGNAENGILSLADYKTETNDKDGVARAIEKFVLSAGS